jgi:hypothetical protein
MASITLSGILLDPNSDFAVGDEIRFTHASTTGQTVKGAVSVVTIAPGGTYSLALQYGLVLVEYKDIRSTQFKNLGIATVNGSNPATTIPELLNALVPVSSAELIEFQAILADCVTAKNAAELAAANLIATQITTTELIASSSTYAADAIITTQGFSVAGVGAGPWVQTGVTGQTASQTPSQLVESLCTDGNGNQWRLMNNGQISISQLGGLVGSNNGAVVFAFNASSATTLDLEGLSWPARDIDCDNATDKGKLQKSFINGTLIVVNSFVNDVDLQTIQPFSQDEIAVSGKKSQVLTWKDKRVLWLGTSIPHQGVGSDGYPELLSSTLDFTVSNWSWSGSHAFYNIAGDAFDSGTVRALSMTEADRLAGLALYGASSAYDDSFNNVTIASEMTTEYRIKNQFIANAYDVVVLDHNHNDRKSVQTYTVNDKTLTAITKGATTVVAVNNTTGLTVGDGAYLQVTGIADLQYAAARITAISSLDVTLAIDSSGYTGSFSSGTLHWVDRNTLEGSFDFLIAYTKNMGIIYGNTSVDIVLCNAPSYFTNNTDRDFSIWNSGKTIKSIADKWSLGYFDVAATLDLIYSQHLIYFPDAVHPSTLETRKALASYWASWMSGGAQTVTNAADSLAKNKLVLDAHQELALFSKYDDAYAYRANLFTDDTPVISEDFSGGIGTWTVTSTPPVIESAPWGAGSAAKFVVTTGAPQPFITKASALAFDPILEFDLYFPTIALATGTSNQLTVFSLITADTTAYNVAIIQSAGGTARLSVSRSDTDVVSVNLPTYLIEAATKYTIKADIIKGDTTSSDGYILLTVNGVKLYADTFANGGVSAITSTRLGAVFNNMGSSFNFFISNIVTGGKTRSPAINWSEIQSPLTTLELIASTGTYAPEAVVNTSGFTTSGGGGKGSWKQNGVTGQTASQSPAQLGFPLLNDGLGNQWALVVQGELHVASLGATNNYTDDDTLPIRAAVSIKNAVRLSLKNRLTGQINSAEGVTLLGTNFKGGILQGPSSIFDNSNTTIYIQFGNGFEDLGVGTTSVSDRTAYFANAAIVLNTGCSIDGVGFYYPDQNMLNNDTVTTPPTKYAPAIIISYLAEATSITNINIGNCYVGIDVRKQHNGCFIKDIYGSPLSIGIRTGSTMGFDDIQDTNFVLGNAYKDPQFPVQGMIDWVGANAINIEQNRSTWVAFQNIKTFGYLGGINIFDSAADATNGLTQTASGQTCTYTGCGFDFCSYGIKGVNTFYLTINGNSFTPKHKDQSLLADTYAVYIDNAGTSEYNITVTSNTVHDADMDGFYFEGINNLNVSNNQIEEISILKAGVGITADNCDQAVISGNVINGKDNANTKGIYAANSRSMSIVNNSTSDINSTPIEIKDLTFSSIQGNMGESNPGDLVIDTSVTPTYSNVIINNVGNTINLDTTDSNVNASSILVVDLGRNFISHSGANDIKGLTAGQNGQIITIRFGASASSTGLIDADSGTPQSQRLFIAGNYGFTFSDTIQLVSRGSLGWYEVSRSVN